jgi:hypothetical protein
MKVRGHLHAPAALTLGKEPPLYPLNRRLAGHRSRSGRCGEKKYLLPLPGIEPRPSSLQPVAIPTEVSRCTCANISKIILETPVNVQPYIHTMFLCLDSDELIYGVVPIVSLMFTSCFRGYKDTI